MSSAAGYLEISEFCLFRLAYRDRYGIDANDRDIDPYFSAYLDRQEVPRWVLLFAREVLRKAEKGTLNPEELGVPPPPPRRFSFKDLVYLLLFFGFIAYFMYMITHFK